MTLGSSSCLSSSPFRHLHCWLLLPMIHRSRGWGQVLGGHRHLVDTVLVVAVFQSCHLSLLSSPLVVCHSPSLPRSRCRRCHPPSPGCISGWGWWRVVVVVIFPVFLPSVVLRVLIVCRWRWSGVECHRRISVFRHQTRNPPCEQGLATVVAGARCLRCPHALLSWLSWLSIVQSST